MTSPLTLERDRGCLAWLDDRLREVVDAFREELSQRAADPFRGLVITDADVDELLSDEPSPHLSLFAAVEHEVPARLEQLATTFGLSQFDVDALQICLAPELDLRYERLYAYLQDDVSRKRPTVDLILRLLRPAGNVTASERDALAPSGALSRSGLLEPADPAADVGPLLARALRPAERVVAHLLGSVSVDWRLNGTCEVLPPAGPAGPDGAGAACISPDAQRLARLLQRSEALEPATRSAADEAGSGEPAFEAPVVVYLYGSSAAVRRQVVRQACSRAELPLLRVDLPALLEMEPEAANLRVAALEAGLRQAVLCLDGVDGAVLRRDSNGRARSALRALLASRTRPLILLGTAPWEPAELVPGLSALCRRLSQPDGQARDAVWRQALAARAFPLEEVEVAALAGRYRLAEDSVRAAVGNAALAATWRGAPRLAEQDIWSAAQEAAAPPLSGLARRLEARYGWDDIVLSSDGLAQLRELSARLRHQDAVLGEWGFGGSGTHRAGATALFAGPPGTGKTMAAEILAVELGLDLYRIDLSAIVSKYIGETEKNLEHIFEAAERGDAILLFDEADALFGKRSEVKDAHDRYANIEVAYLLQRLEAYEGLALLTTNMRGNLDDAFLRRLDFAVDFPLPDEAQRLNIWQRSIPATAPLAEDIDLPFLARRFKIAGGHIHNIALGAAFLAAEEHSAISMRHLVRATRREHQKLGRLVAEADFERYYTLLSDG